MRTITATELARNLRDVLDRLVSERQEIVIERNNREIARLVPLPGHQTALEALADLYRTLPDDAAEGWRDDARQGLDETLDDGLRDPWAS